MNEQSMEVRRKYWESKYRIAKTNHAAEIEKMGIGGPGASLIALDRASRAIDRAARELRKLEAR